MVISLKSMNLLISPATEENVERKSRFSICGEMMAVPLLTTGDSSCLLEHLGCSLQLDSFCFSFFFFFNGKNKKLQRQFCIRKGRDSKRDDFILEHPQDAEESSQALEKKISFRRHNKNKSSWKQLKTGVGVMKSHF